MPAEYDPELTPEQRRTAEARKREVIRNEAAIPVREKIEQQLRESGIA